MLHDPAARIALAVLLATAASLCYAVGIALQHNTVGTSLSDSDSRSVGLKSFLALLRNPRWLGGLALILGSAAGHLGALSMAPVTVVQPIGILAIPWSIVIADRAYGHKPTARVWQLVALTVAGITVFTALSATNAAIDTIVNLPVIIAAGIVVYALAAALGLFGWRGPQWLRCMAWAASAAVTYGLATGLIKVGLVVLQHGTPWTDPLVWGIVIALVVTYVVAAWIVQQAYASGSAAIAVGAMTTIDPVIAVLFGIVVLGEGARTGTGEFAGMVASGLVAIGAVMWLSRHQEHMPAVAGQGDHR